MQAEKTDRSGHPIISAHRLMLLPHALPLRTAGADIEVGHSQVGNDHVERLSRFESSRKRFYARLATTGCENHVAIAFQRVA